MVLEKEAGSSADLGSIGPVPSQLPQHGGRTAILPMAQVKTPRSRVVGQ
jgi:hypothetical protein